RGGPTTRWAAPAACGEVAKRSNATDCKSVGPRPSKVRILPSPPSSFFPGLREGSEANGRRNEAGVAQLVELQPSKLDVAGSNPVARSTSGDGNGWRRRAVRCRCGAHVAQPAERVLGKD